MKCVKNGWRMTLVSTKANRHVVVILVDKPQVFFIANDVYYAVAYIKSNISVAKCEFKMFLMSYDKIQCNIRATVLLNVLNVSNLLQEKR